MRAKLITGVFLICTRICCSLQGQTTSGEMIILDDSKNKVKINSSVYIFQDTLNSILPNDILSGKYDAFFKRPANHLPGLGTQSKTIWNKFTIQVNASQENYWLLIADQAGLDTMMLYYRDTLDNFQSIGLSRQDFYAKRKYKFNNFVLDLPVNGFGNKVFYLKVVSQVYNCPLLLINQNTFTQLSLKRNIIQGIFIGFFIMMLLYNLFIYFFERDKSFILYVIYVLVNGLMICGFKDYLDYFMPNKQNLVAIYLPAIISLNSLALIFFSRNILELPKNVRFAEKVLVYGFVPLITISLAFVSIKEQPWNTTVNLLILFILLVFLSFSAFLVYKRNVRSALFYIFGCAIILTSSLWYLFSLYGLLPINTLTNHVLELGSVAQIMLFSFALGDKIREYKKLKYQTEKELLESLKQNEEIILEQNRILEINAAERAKELITQKEKSDKLLLNILPEDVALELKEYGAYEAKLHSNVSVMYSDFVNFTKISEHLSPKQLVESLDFLFKAFDDIIDRNGLEKIKTIGDAYLAVCGLQSDSAHAVRTVKAAIEIRDFLSIQNHTVEIFEIRIGIHSGPVVAGIVGDLKFTYDIWGETVNVANKLEQISEPGKVNISNTTKCLLNDEFQSTPEGSIVTKTNMELDYYFVEHK